MEEIEVFLSTDDKMEPLDTYILIIPSTDNIEIYNSSTLYQDYTGVLAAWDCFIEKLAALSDQDIFEFCKDAELDYDLVIDLVRENRSRRG